MVNNTWPSTTAYHIMSKYTVLNSTYNLSFFIYLSENFGFPVFNKINIYQFRNGLLIVAQWWVSYPHTFWNPQSFCDQQDSYKLFQQTSECGCTSGYDDRLLIPFNADEQIIPVLYLLLPFSLASWMCLHLERFLESIYNLN